MLDLFTNRKAGRAALPARLTTLSVSWLNGEFKAMAVHRGLIEGTWEHRVSIEGQGEGVGQFEALIREAVAKTGFRGHTVSLLLGHPRLVQQVVDAPPVKRADLRRILHRQAQQQKMFVGEAAWTCQDAFSGKGERRILLHLFPKALLFQLMQACKRAGLYLTAVVPPSAVLHHQLQQLGLEKGEVGLLAAETGGSTTVVIGRGDGQIILARNLAGNWNDGADRLALDLNRTILFVNQQYGIALSKGARLFGTGAAQQAAFLQVRMQLPVEASPVAYEPFYWATESLKLRPALRPDFISPELQKAPQRRVFAKVVATATLAGVIACLAISAYAFMQARQEQANIKTLSTRLQRLETQRDELQRRHFKLTRQKEFARLVLDERPGPVPLWFLGYLSEAVPSELVVTNLQVQRAERVWKVQIAGTFQAAIKQPTPEAMTEALTLLTNRLSSGPFHLQLLDEQETAAAIRRKTSPAGDSISSWVANVASGVSARPAPPTDQFVLEGVMR